MSYLQAQIGQLIQQAKQQEQTEPYHEVLQWTATDGTQYIDTGFIADENSKIEIGFNILDTGTSVKAIFGSRKWNGSTISQAFYLYKTNSAIVQVGWGSQSKNITLGNSSELQSPVRLIIDKGSVTIVTTSNTYTETFTSETFETPTSLIIGTCRTGTQGTELDNRPASVDVRYCRLWDNGTLVLDYKPALNNKMQPCLYDSLGKSFAYAKKISDDTATYDLTYKRWNKFDVDYIESSGTQYINTGYAFEDDFSYEIEYKGLNNGECLLGGRTSSVRTAILYRAMATQVDGQTTVPIAGLNATQTPFKLGVLSDTKHTIKVAIANNKGNIWVDDTQIYTNQSFTGTYISGKTTAIFADHFGDQTGASEYQEYATSQLYALKFWQGTNLVRDFKPTVWHNGNTTAVACLYDEVYNKMYTNAGTGSFKAYVAPETTVYTLNDGVQNDDYYLAENGVKTASADHTSCYSNAFAVKQGDIIEWTVTAEQVSANKRIHGYTTNDDIEVNSAGSWVQMLAKIVFSTTSDTTQTATFTVPSGINYIRVSHANVRESVCTVKRIRTYEVGKSISNGQGAGYDLSVPYSNNFVFEAITTCKTTSSNYFMDTRKVISGSSTTYQSDTGAFGIGGSSTGSTMNWKDGTGNNTIVATGGTNWSRIQSSLPFRYNAKLVGWDEDGNHKRTAIFYHFGSGKNSDRVVTNGVNVANNRATVTLLYTTSANVLSSGSDLSYVYFAQDGNVEYDVIPVRNATVTSDVLLFNRANKTRVARLTITGSPSITFNALD